MIGLTGGSGSGKSSIARQLEALGAVRVDCDKLGHKVYQPGTAGYHRVLQEFGSGGETHCLPDVYWTVCAIYRVVIYHTLTLFE